MSCQNNMIPPIVQLYLTLLQKKDKILHTIDLNKESWDMSADACIALLTEALPNTDVTTIDLTNIGIGDDACAALAKVLPNTKLTTINFNSNRVGKNGCIALAEALPNSNVMVIHLNCNNIGRDGCIALSKALPNTSITTLNLHDNKIGYGGCLALSKALSNTTLTTVDLGSNNIGTDGCIALAEALPNAKVKTIRLNGNEIDDAGCVALAEALPNTQVTSIDLESNRIGNDGCIALAKALPNTKIQSIRLDNNRFGDGGCIELAKALPNAKVTSLHLYGCDINRAGLQAILEALQYNDVLTCISLGGLYFHDYGEMEQIRKIVKANKNGTRGDAVKDNRKRKWASDEEGKPSAVVSIARPPPQCLPLNQEDTAIAANSRAAQIRTISHWLAEVIGFGADTDEMIAYATQMRDLGFHSIDMIKELCTPKQVQSFHWMSEMHKLQFQENAGLKKSPEASC